MIKCFTDIDECAQEMHNCPDNFKCQNEVKSCFLGY